MSLRQLTAGVLLAVLCASAFGDAVPLTSGPGNDTEAAWSPDGKWIAFQTDRNGDLDIYLLDLATQKLRALVTGPGHACFPSWSPDSERIVYSYAHYTSTAFEGIESGCNLYVTSAAGGEPRQLTRGLYRDYAPRFSPDARRVYFSAGRHAKLNAVSIFSVPFAGGAPATALHCERRDEATVQIDFSPDGRLAVYGYIAGFRDNWALRIARAADLADFFPLTDSRAAFYAPRWSPAGNVIACTGYEPGDSGWNVWAMRLDPLTRTRLTDGPGNSRSPSWSPDGREVVFENNATGTYKLYRKSAVQRAAGPGAASAQPAGVAASRAETVLRYDFTQPTADMVKDLSRDGNDGTLRGACTWEGGALCFDGSSASVAVQKPRGLDFGAGPFWVSARVRMREHSGELQLICCGDYPGNQQGWQLFINEDNKVHFNARKPDLTYVGAFSDREIPTGRPVSLVGVRSAAGAVRLYVDGALQRRQGSGATRVYPNPAQFVIGASYNNRRHFGGRIFELSVHSDEPDAGLLQREGLRTFLSR